MYMLSVNIRITLSEEIIESICRILHTAHKRINKTNVLEELRYILKEKGTLGIEYIYDQDTENATYKGMKDDIQRICKQLNI